MVAEEAQPAVRVKSPLQPTAAEIAEHEATGHVVYRSWCPACCSAKGHGQPHRTAPEEDDTAVPTIMSDYGFMGQDDGKCLPILCIKDRRTKRVAATFLEAKGNTPYGQKFFENFLLSTGYKRVINKSDGEPAMVSLKTKAIESAGIEGVPQESPVGDHQANGEAEAAVRDLKRQVRVLKISLESKLGLQLKDDDPVLAWMPRHAGDLINRYRRGEDGKTPEQRRTGKQWRKPALEYGERVFFREAVAAGLKNSFEAVMQEGRYIGHHGRTGALLCITPEGVKRGKSFRRLPAEERWVTEGWSALKGLPWEIKARASRVPAIGDGEATPVVRPLMVPEAGPRRLYVLSGDVDKYGPTPGCPACDSVSITGRVHPGQPHTEACRQRMERLLAEDDEGQQRLQAQRRRGRPGATRPEEAGPGPEGADVPMVEQPSADAGGAPPGIPQQGARRRRRRVAAGPADGGAQPDAGSGQQQQPEAGTAQPAQQPAGATAAPPAASSSSGSQAAKRPAEDPPDDPRAAGTTSSGPELVVAPPQQSMDTSGTAAGPQNVEDLVDQAMGSLDDAGPRFPTIAHNDVGSLESIDTGSLTSFKAELMSHIRSRVQDVFRVNCVDCDSGSLNSIAQMCVELGSVDVAEIYSPHRVTARASEFGLRPGFAVDLLEDKPEGYGSGKWDLDSKEDVALLRVLQDEQDPMLLVGSPPCTPFSQIHNIMSAWVDPEKRAFNLEKGRHHLRVSVDAYKRQLDRGRFFLHEHPWSASSWEEPEMKKLTSDERVYVVKGPMCKWNLKPPGDQPVDGVPHYHLKETGWVTNSKKLADTLQGVCSNVDGSRPLHRHVRLLGGLGHIARIYTPELVAAILQALRGEMLETGDITATEMVESGPISEEPSMPEGPWSQYWDDVNGGYLDPDLVKEARAKEREWVKKQQIWRIVPRAQCLERTGRPPIPLRWVDTNKGDRVKPNYRSRIVAKDIKAKKKGTGQELDASEVFSSMPPLEGLMILSGLFANLSVSGYKLAAFDISRAHFYGVAEREVYVDLEQEDKDEFGSDKCGLLLKSMYGTQDASAIWQRHYSSILESAGFARGRSNGAVFYKESGDIRVLVHGDDFLVLAKQEEIESFEGLLKGHYEYKRTFCIGFEEGDQSSGVFLNRVISVDNNQGRRVMIEPDSRHAQLLVRELGLEGSKGLDTPIEHRSVEQQLRDHESPSLAEGQAKTYRSCCMRVAYLAQDRPDLGEASKVLARYMRSPNQGAWGNLKHVGRYLLKHPQIRREFRPGPKPDRVRCFVDSDHAGCAVTRKSSTGLVCKLGQNVVKHSDNLQGTISLSSGESEFYAIVKAAQAGIGLQSLLADWGLHLSVEVLSDSSAARGHVSRRGLGKMRHIQTRYLWVQERVGEGHIKITCVPGTKNVADVLTKAVSGVLLRRHLAAMGFAPCEPHERQRGLL